MPKVGQRDGRCGTRSRLGNVAAGGCSARPRRLFGVFSVRRAWSSGEHLPCSEGVEEGLEGPVTFFVCEKRAMRLHHQHGSIKAFSGSHLLHFEACKEKLDSILAISVYYKDAEGLLDMKDLEGSRVDFSPQRFMRWIQLQLLLALVGLHFIQRKHVSIEMI